MSQITPDHLEMPDWSKVKTPTQARTAKQVEEDARREQVEPRE